MIHFLLILVPVLIPNVMHMYVVRYNWFSPLNQPISLRLYGANKTYRGFFVVPLFSIPAVYLTGVIDQQLPQHLSIGYNQVSTLLFAMVLGLAYCLGELPNSFVKRRAGIAPGKTCEKNPIPYIICDHLDSSIPCILAFYYFLNISAGEAVILWLMGCAIHFAVNYILYLFGVRKNPL